MSTHPNALLIAQLSPNDLSRKTYKALKVECGYHAEDTDCDVKIPNGIESDEKFRCYDDYHIELAESDYIESCQISAEEGSIILWDPVTYGYGERIEWADLERQRNTLDAWCKQICEKLNCTYKIFVTANYW